MGATVVTVEVPRTPAEAFDYVTDPARFGEWQRDVVTARRLAGDPRRAGGRYETTRAVGPLKLRTTTVSEVAGSDPPRDWVARVLTGPVRSTVTVRVEPLDAGARSRVTVAVDYAGHGIGRLLVPLVVRRQSAKQAPDNRRALLRHLG